MHLLRSLLLTTAVACAFALAPARADVTPDRAPATTKPSPGAKATGSSHAEARRVTLQGGRNMRSPDGLPVRGGTLRAGALYRSARLTHLSTDDVAKVNALHLVTLIDVRMGLESMFQGPDSEGITAHRVYLPMHAPMKPGKTFYLKIIQNKNSEKAIARFFATLADKGSYPLLYHCGIGKDRTGTLTALLLDLLGTPRDVIFDDYLASGKTANSAWLQQVFDEVDKHGGIEAYLKSLGVNADQLDAVRRNLVVPAG